MNRPCRGCRWFNDRDGKCKNIYGPRFERSVGPDDSCAKHERFENCCGFNAAVRCRNPGGGAECLRCGWHPEKAQQRIERRRA